MKRSYSRKNLRLNSRRSKRGIQKTNKRDQKTNDRHSLILRQQAHIIRNIQLTIKERKASEYDRLLDAAKTDQERREIIKAKEAKKN
jgi:hypothetical protein